ncbi:alpha-2-macroglobulin N-terminal region family protein [Lysobacter gummosus]|nr:alpha-2-macroglobulin N-terminal region family protein [Lysobacter gummosus]
MRMKPLSARLGWLRALVVATMFWQGCATAAPPPPATAAAPTVGARFDNSELTLTFAEPMRIWGNRVEPGSVRLAPSIGDAAAMQCHWQGDTSMFCTFGAAEPADATEYRIQIADGLLTQQGAVLPAQTLSVSTDRPSVNSTMVWEDGQPVISLFVRQKIRMNDLARVLRLDIGGQPAPVRLKPIDDDGDSYRLELPAKIAPQTRLELSIVPGLRSSAGPLPGVQNAVLQRALVNEPFRVIGAACAQPHSAPGRTPVDGRIDLQCMPDEAVQLVFSQPLSEASRQAWIASWPKGVTLYTRRSWNEGYGSRIAREAGEAISFGRDAARSRFDMRLEGLRSQRGDPIQPLTLSVNTLDYRSMLRGPHARALIADGRKPPLLLQTVNAQAGSWPLRGLDGKWLQGLQAGPARRHAEPERLPSPSAEAVLARGGWVGWYANDAVANGAHPNALVEASAPAFDLFATATAGEVLVWAQAWDDGGAIAGAEVELLLQVNGGVPARIARGRTDGNGLARLELPAALRESAKASDQRLILRATQGQGAAVRRAVLPAERWFSLQALQRNDATQIWGVADKPLYRAGETVRYRLWLRQIVGERLLRPAASENIELSLSREDEEEAILTWSERFDAGGSLSAERGLPSQLTDGRYCIHDDAVYSAQGVCFFVGSYRAQDLWAQARTEDRVLHDGDRFAFDLQAGYYSGGAAVDIGVERVTAILSPLRLQEAYPRFADYSFIDVGGHGSHALIGAKELRLRTDAQGRAHGELKTRFDDRPSDGKSSLPAFGRIQVVGEVRLADREGTASNAAPARYSRYRRFVGLRSDPSWFSARSPVRLEAVVIDDNGIAVPDAPVEIEVRWLRGYDQREDDAKAPVLHRCSLRAQQPAACDFPREKTGRYRITARSGEAAPAELSRYVWVGSDYGDDNAKAGEPALELIRAASAQDRSVEVLLRQPYAKAQVLFVFEDGRHLMGERVETVEGQEQRYRIVVPQTRSHSYSLLAYVREAVPSKIDEHGLRTPPRRGSADLSLVAPPLPAPAPLSLSFASAAARPGERVRLRVRNDSAQPREVAISVMDDALRSLAGENWEEFDPANANWLGGLKSHYTSLSSQSFTRFDGGAWKLALARSDAKTSKPSWPGVMFELDKAMPSGTPFDFAADEDSQDPSKQKASAEANALAAYIADADADADIADAAASPADPESDHLDRCPSCSVVAIGDYRQASKPVESPKPSRGRGGGYSYSYVAPAAEVGSGTGAIAPSDRDGDYASTVLDSIQVTGSRIGLKQALRAGSGKVEGVRPREQTTDAAAMVSAAARVRTRFVDTVHWLPQLRLAPGESREIELTLPDNLTRWRAVAWSNDADDDFTLTETTLDVGLPLEARLQTPVRLYPGDRSRLAANARHSGDSAAQVATQLRVTDATGEGEALAQSRDTLQLAPQGQGSFAVEIAPRQVGALLATASVEAGGERDAVAAPIEIATPLIAGRLSQAGWLGAQPLSLALPELPAGAMQPQLQVSLLRGSAALVDRWTEDLHAYPHRCWEQILSRGLVAALSLQRGPSSPWPQDDARAAVREAVENAAVFQNEAGDFRYFTRAPEQYEAYRRYDLTETPEVALTAYSLRALRLLKQLGYPVQGHVLEAAEDFVGDQQAPAALDPQAQVAGDQVAINQAAIAVGAEDEPSSDKLDRLWSHWSRLQLPAQIELTRALARARHASAAAALARVVAQTRRNGAARAFDADVRLDRWMSSDLREQCAVIGLLRDYPRLGDSELRLSLISGLSDLYAGGSGAIDTQAGAYCVWALNDDVRADARRSASASVAFGEQRALLELAPGEARGEWKAPAAQARALQLARKTQGDTPLSFVATLDYVEDANHAVANAAGLAVERRFEVLRDGEWKPLTGAKLRENDWVRITLIVSNGAERHFVAITDNAPGGLFPTDLSLSGVGGLDLSKVSDTGSWWFRTRKLDPRKPRFYAEELPAGRHEVRYFARAGNAGDYLAAPAQVELMYGGATQARTAAERVTVLPPD